MLQPHFAQSNWAVKCQNPPLLRVTVMLHVKTHFCSKELRCYTPKPLFAQWLRCYTTKPFFAQSDWDVTCQNPCLLRDWDVAWQNHSLLRLSDWDVKCQNPILLRVTKMLRDKTPLCSDWDRDVMCQDPSFSVTEMLHVKSALHRADISKIMCPSLLFCKFPSVLWHNI